MTTLAGKIRELRLNKGFSLEQLAKQANASKGYLWEIENPRPGKNPLNPSAKKLSKIALALGVTAEYLLDSNQSSPSNEVQEEAFFRKFSKLKEEDKEKIEQMIENWASDN